MSELPIRPSSSRSLGVSMSSMIQQPANRKPGLTPFPRTAAVVLLAIGLSGCATATITRSARDAERRQDYDVAVVEYTKLLRMDPDNADARLSLERAKLRASQDHWTRARRFSATGKLDQALVEYEVAAELNPTNNDIDNELRSVRNQLRDKVAISREGKTELETLVAHARELPPPGLDLPTDVRMPGSLAFRDASSRDVFQTIAKFANIGVGFD